MSLDVRAETATGILRIGSARLVAVTTTSSRTAGSARAGAVPASSETAAGASTAVPAARRSRRMAVMGGIPCSWSDARSDLSKSTSDLPFWKLFPSRATFDRMKQLLIAALLALTGSALAQQPEYDVVIRNGRVLDGMGNPWVSADVAIRDGRLAKIGRVEGRGRREIDARGDYVAPGFIDMMDQSGEVLRKNGTAENKLRQGVTTAIAGEGGTPVPSAQIAEYFAQLERQGISLNFGTYYSAAQARVEVMGDRAGAPTREQMEKMKAHVSEAMSAGAQGIATALIYPPDSFQSTDDLVELAQVAAKYGGIYASHMRDESADLLKAIQESIDICERAGIQVEIFHFKAAWRPGWGKLVPEAGALIEHARSRGDNIAADIYVYVAGGTGL